MGNKKHSIGKAIAELRKSKGWTQVELAEKLQVSDKAISKWEKDNGAPSVEFFPVLAELFGVSIDYIMTGKQPEPEIITVSKLELCAKNDDVKLFDSLSEEVINGKDENGKTLLNYAFEYRCPKVVDSLLKKYAAKDLFDWTCSGEYIVRFWYPEQILELLIRYSRINDLDELGAFSDIFYGNIRRTKDGNNAPNIFTAPFKKIVFTDDNISIEFKCKYLKWCNSTDIVEFLNHLVDINDEMGIKMVFPLTEEISLPSTLIKKMADKGYIYIVKQANEPNLKVGISILNKEKSLEGLSEKELTVLKVVKNGIVDIDALSQIKDYDLAKEILFNNPIHQVELLYNLLNAGKIKELFRYAVDHCLSAIVNYIKKNQIDEIKLELVKMFEKTLTVAEGYPVINGKVVKIKQFNRYAIRIDEIIQFFADYKQQILTELSYELDKQKTIGNLTKEYFENELKKENYEIAIVKLCVRLEAILRCDYHYEGDFSEMLTEFCKQVNDTYASNILNKLRMHRNSIVHSEKESEQLSLDELKYCIDYICKLG